MIAAEFFDIDKSRSIPWQRRPEASRLLAELANPDRGFSAVVIGEPHRALASHTVVRIFAEFLNGSGLFTIAEGLTRDGIPSPSAHDRVRNSHRSGLAWSKSAVRAILTNPRYTGRQVWNRQRKDEVLLDVNDVARGHITQLRWNTERDWI